MKYDKPIPQTWSLATIRDIVADISAGTSVNGFDSPALAGQPGVLKLSAVSQGRFFPSENKAVKQEEHERLGPSVEKGTLLFSRSNTSELVGECSYIRQDHPNLHVPDLLWIIKPETTCDPIWMQYLFAARPVRRGIKAIATGTSGSMKKIAMGSFRKVWVPVPPLSEQKKIANILSAWDRAIELTEKQIAQKRQLKKGLMQQLLAGKRRFKEFVKSKEVFQTRFGDYPKDWQYIRLERVAQEVSERNSDGASHQVLSCTKYDGLVDSLSYFGKQIFSDDLSTYKVVRRHQFAYATNHIEEGSIGYQDSCDVAVISPMYTVFQTTDGVDDSFLYQLLKSDLYVHIYQVNTNASVNRRGSLRWTAFSHIRIPLPSIEEQRAIAAVLDEQQREIDMLEKKIDSLRQQKRGLMQQLLTGKKRVKAGKGGKQ